MDVHLTTGKKIKNGLKKCKGKDGKGIKKVSKGKKRKGGFGFTHHFEERKTVQNQFHRKRTGGPGKTI